MQLPAREEPDFSVRRPSDPDNRDSEPAWFDGYVRAWARREDGWWAHVVFSRGRGSGNYPDVVHESDVRPARKRTQH